MISSKKAGTILIIYAVIITAAMLVMGHFDSPEYNAYEPNPITVTHTEIQANKNDKININTATAEELMQLESIGKVRAQKIIEYRENNGGFVSVEEITNIDGISTTFHEKNIDKITV